MAYISSALSLWRFNGNPYDEISNANFVLNNDDPYTSGAPIGGVYSSFSRFNLWTNQNESIQGLQLGGEISYEADLVSYVSGSFTIGLWINTTAALGYTRHVVTRESTPRTAPILAKSDRLVTDEEEFLESATFVIVEKASSKTQNQLELLLSSNGTTSTSVLSASYLPGLHHFLLTYDENEERARIDVDGSFGEWQTAPASLNSSIATLKINAINPNYISHQFSYTNTVLRDLYFRDAVSIDETESIRNVKYGVDYVTDSLLSLRKFAPFAVSFTQPNTIATNSILVNGSTVYLGQSDGSLLKGEQPIWDNNFNFDSTKKNSLLTFSEAGTASYTDDGVVLKGSFIRI